jgi:hypothetical protein
MTTQGDILIVTNAFKQTSATNGGQTVHFLKMMAVDPTNNKINVIAQ